LLIKCFLVLLCFNNLLFSQSDDYKFLAPSTYFQKSADNRVAHNNNSPRQTASSNNSDNPYEKLLTSSWKGNILLSAIDDLSSMTSIIHKIAQNLNVFDATNIKKILELKLNDRIMVILSEDFNFTDKELQLLWTIFGLRNPLLRNRVLANKDLRQLRSSLHKIIKKIQEPVNIYELGCSEYAFVLQDLKIVYDEINIAAGIDLTIKLSDEDQKRAGITLESGNFIRKHKWSDHTFHVIYENYALGYMSFDDLSFIVTEIWRLLKPGGYFITSSGEMVLRTSTILDENGFAYHSTRNGVIQKAPYDIKPSFRSFFTALFHKAS